MSRMSPLCAQIWGNPGVGVNINPGYLSQGIGAAGTFGAEGIYIPQQNCIAIYWYGGAGPALGGPDGPAWSVGINAQMTYNLTAAADYEGAFLAGGGSYNGPSGFGVQGGYATTPAGWQNGQYPSSAQPAGGAPATYYAGASLGSPGWTAQGQAQNYYLIGTVPVPWNCPYQYWSPFQIFGL